MVLQHQVRAISQHCYSISLFSYTDGGSINQSGAIPICQSRCFTSVVTTELSGLQDEVPSENFEDIGKVIETEFGMPLLEKYLELDPVPLAAASLGQAHLAKIALSHEQAQKLE